MILKKFLLPIVSLTIIISVMAFTQPSKNTTLTKASVLKPDLVYYFHYIGPVSPTSFSEYIDPDNYVMLVNQGPDDYCYVGNDEICTILCDRVWVGFEWKPDFSDTTTPGNVHGQLFWYWAYGGAGPSMSLKDIE